MVAEVVGGHSGIAEFVLHDGAGGVPNRCGCSLVPKAESLADGFRAAGIFQAG